MTAKTEARLIWPAMATAIAERHPNTLETFEEMVEEMTGRGDALARKFMIGQSQVTASILVGDEGSGLLHVTLRIGEMDLSTNFVHGVDLPASISMNLVGRPLREIVYLDLIPQDVIITDVMPSKRGHRIAHDWSRHNEIRNVADGQT